MIIIAFPASPFKPKMLREAPDRIRFIPDDAFPRRLSATVAYNIRVSGSHPTKETLHMPLQTHLAELEQRHRALEDEISEALTHPSSDGLKIAELKRRKLQVKDEIARLQTEVSFSLH
jgi:hypothetical protein